MWVNSNEIKCTETVRAVATGSLPTFWGLITSRLLNWQPEPRQQAWDGHGWDNLFQIPAPSLPMQDVRGACNVHRKLKFKCEAAVSSTSKGFLSECNNLFSKMCNWSFEKCFIKPHTGHRTSCIWGKYQRIDRLLEKMCNLKKMSLKFWRFRCFLEDILQSHDPRLAGLEPTCQTSGQVASSHLANSRPDISPVFDVRTGNTLVLGSHS